MARSPGRVAAGAGLGLLLVVAAATGAAGGGAKRGAAPASAGAAPALGGPSWAGDIVLAFLAAAVVGLAWWLVSDLLSERRRPGTGKSPWWVLPVAIVLSVPVSLALLGLLVFAGRRGREASSGQNLRRVLQGGGRGARLIAPHVAKAAPTADLGWAVLAGAVLALLALAGQQLWRHRPAATAGRWLSREGAGPVVTGEQRQGALQAMDESIEALEREPDPRRAVIAAYARMDRWLARAGFARQAWEAPFEHLDRIVADLGATAAVGATLAGLFERAKFDRRPCGQDMRSAALSALTRLRDDIATLSRAGAA